MKELTEKQRTSLQNRSLHKLFNDISNHCIETGLDQKTIVKALTEYTISASPQFIKEIWRSIQISLTGKKSTTDLNTKEIDQVYDVFNKFISEITGEHFAFPNIQDLLHSQLDDRGNLKWSPTPEKAVEHLLELEKNER